MPILGTVIALGGLVVADGLRGAAKATKLDEQTLKKLGKAYDKAIEAQRLIKEQEEKADRSLNKVINRKRAILTNTIPEFMNVYEKIQKINFTPGKGIKELEKLSLPVETLGEIKEMAAVVHKTFTNTELFVGLFLLGPAVGGGIGNMMIKDSKRQLAAANTQLRFSETMYSQAETYQVAYDAIIQRAEKIAKILSKLDLLFYRAINTTRDLIESKGYDIDVYNDNELGIMMTCVNMASTVKQYLDVPLLDTNGKVTEASLKAIETGNAYISKIENFINSY